MISHHVANTPRQTARSSSDSPSMSRVTAATGQPFVNSLASILVAVALKRVRTF